MKNFVFAIVSLFVLILSSSTMAQWVPQIVPGLPNSSDPQILFSPVDDNVCWGFNLTNSQFLKTTNGGTPWTVSTVTNASGLQGQGVSALDVNTAWIAMRDPSGITSGGIFKTTDGGNTWTKQTTAFQGSGGIPRVIHFFDANNGLCVGDPRNNEFEIYTTSDGGNNWILVSGTNIPNPVQDERAAAQFCAQGIGNYFWFQTFNDALYRTTDRGINWTVTRNVLGIDGAGPFAFKDTLNGLTCIFVGGNKLSRTTNGGLTWTPLTLHPDLANLSTFFIAYVKGTPGAYVITSHNNFNGINPAIPGSAYTLDDGNSWTYINNTKLGAARFSDWNTGWAGGINDTIWKWNSDTPVELTSFTAKIQNQTVLLNWVTATEINNRGFEIQRKVAEGDFATVGFVKGEGTTTNQKEYSYVDKILVDGKYFYRLKQMDFSGKYEYSNTIEVEVRSLDNYTLEQNYPNPFNPTTTIGYVLQEKSSTKLTLINVIGEEVAILVNEEQDKGYHKVDLNAHNLPSGVYLYKLQAGNFVETKKLMLLK